MTTSKQDEAISSKSPVLLHVGVYNASGIPKKKVDWNKDHAETVTAQMYFAFEGKVFELEGKSYRFIPRIIDFLDISKSILDSIDLLVAPGGNAYWKDQFSHPYKAEMFRKNIKSFVKKGGGYIGTCGGASIVTLGKKEPPGRTRHERKTESIPEWLNLDCYLKMVKIWSNGFWLEEQQYNSRPTYETKSHLGGIPLDSHVFDTDDAKTILGIQDSTINIRYWGGSAYWGGRDKIIPLANFEQEPKNTYPLHWRTGVKVQTDLMENDGLSILAATYGKGRLVLFSQHPEVPSFCHGFAEDVVENRQKTKYRFNKNIDASTDEKNKDLLRSAGRWCTKHSTIDIPHKSDEAVKSPAQDDSKKSNTFFQILIKFFNKIFRK